MKPVVVVVVVVEVVVVVVLVVVNDQGVSPTLTWHALVQLYKGYLCKALSSVAEGPAYALRVVR